MSSESLHAKRMHGPRTSHEEPGRGIMIGLNPTGPVHPLSLTQAEWLTTGEQW